MGALKCLLRMCFLFLLIIHPCFSRINYIICVETITLAPHQWLLQDDEAISAVYSHRARLSTLPLLCDSHLFPNRKWHCDSRNWWASCQRPSQMKGGDYTLKSDHKRHSRHVVLRLSLGSKQKGIYAPVSQHAGCKQIKRWVSTKKKKTKKKTKT